MKATNIKWDTDGDKYILRDLPKEVTIPDEITEAAIADYLSNEYGFCHFGFEIEKQEGVLCILRF